MDYNTGENLLPGGFGFAFERFDFRESGTLHDMYGLPSFLRFDWINNESWSNDERNELGDYRFVYVGAKGTWTPFHVDVMNSYSWSANICGRKLWYFVSPSCEEYFRIDCNTFIKDIRTVKQKWPVGNVFPLVQESGEIVFVPSNWYHQVHNLENTISINHNLINAGNVNLVVELIIKRLADVDRELADCKSCFSTAEYNMYCEQILSADIRISITQLSALLELIIVDRGSDVDECWICPNHFSVIECKRNDNCLESMRKAVRKHCECHVEKDEICNSCLKFMKKFEISVAADCLALISRIRKERS